MSQSETDNDKTHDALIAEVAALRRQLAELQTADRDTTPEMCDHLAVCYQSLNETGHILQANTEWLALLGYDHDEVIGRPFEDFLAPDQRTRFGRHFARFKAAGVVRGAEFELLRKDGGIVHIAIDGRVETDATGAFVRTHSVLHDLSRKHRRTAALLDERERLASQVETQTEALGEAEGFYRSILEGIMNGVWVCDRAQRITYVNNAMVQIAGIPADAIIGVDVLADFPEETLQHFRPCFEKAMETLQPVRYDALPVVTPAGRPTFQAGWLIPQVHGGTYDGMICTVADVTERIAMAQALEEERALLHTLIDTLPDRIFVKDREARFVLNNRAHLRAVGIATQEEMLGKTDRDVFPAALAEQYMQDDNAVLSSGEPIRDHETPGYDAQGGKVWVRTTKLPLRDSQGEVKGLVGIAHDISDLKRTEAELRGHRDQLEQLVEERTAELAQERDLLQALMDHMPDLIYFKDRESRFLRVSDAHLKFMGFDDPADVIGKTDFDIFTPEHAAAAFADEQRIVETRQPMIGKLELIRRADGVFCWVSASKVPLYDRNGEIIGTLGVTRDVDEMIRLQETLEAERQRLRAVLDSVPEFIVFKDRDSAFQLWNQQVADFLALPAEQIRGKTDFDFFDAASAQRYRLEELRAMETGETIVSEWLLPGPHGALWESATKVPMRDERGRIIGVLSIGRDVTAERELRQALTHERDLLNALLSSSPDYIYFKDTEARFTRVNRACAYEMGYGEPEEVVGLSDFDVYSPEHAVEAYADDMRVLETGDPVIGKLELDARPDGFAVWVSTTKIPLFDTEGHIVGLAGISRNVDELVRAQAERDEQRRMLQLVLDTIPDFVLFKDLDSRFQLLNEAAAASFGERVDDMIGKCDADFFPPEEASRYRAEELEVIETGKTVRREHRVTAPTGTRWDDSIRVPLRSDDGDVIGILVISRNVTERHRMEEMLRLTQFSVDTSAIGMFRIAPDGHFLYVNDTACRNLGYTREELLQMSVWDVDPNPTYGNAERTARWDMLTRDKVQAFESRHRRKDGSTFPVFVRAQYLLYGGLEYEFVSAIDITEQKRAEETLQHRLALEAAIAAISQQFVTAGPTDMTDILRILGETVGADRTYIFEMSGDRRTLSNTHEWCAPGVDPRSQGLQGIACGQFAWWLTRMEPGQVLMVDDIEALPAATRAECPLLQSRGVSAFLAMPLHSASGSLHGFIGFDDITGPRHWPEEDVRSLKIAAGMISSYWDTLAANRALRESEERFRAIFDRAGMGVMLTDLDGHALQSNPAMTQILGYTAEDLAALTFHEYTHPDDFEADDVLYQQMLRDGPDFYQNEERYVRQDGETVWAQITVTLIRDPAGNPSSSVVMVQDVTERKQLEQQLRQSQKMEAVGTLAGGVAHDFNNLLTAITGYTDFLLQEMSPGTSQYEDVVGIKRAANRAADLTRQLLAFSRRQILQPRVLDLNDIVANLMKMLERLVGEDIDIRTELAPNLGKVRVDPSQMEQVIMNLIVNAREAMPSGGSLTIETRNVWLGEDYAREHVEVLTGRYAMLAVSDTGAGMDQRTLARIFEPFFTTKDLGTGLGLATVYGIVKQSGGHITVYSEPERGTTFRVYMPRIAQDDELAQLDESASPVTGGAETILLVEDDEMVRRLARRALQVRGYTVLEAAHGEDAMKLCLAHRDEIALLLTDVVMPSGISGKQLADRARTVCPELKVLYMSGYTNNAIVHHGVLDAGTDFLEKPFTPDSLASKVREVLDRPS